MKLLSRRRCCTDCRCRGSCIQLRRSPKIVVFTKNVTNPFWKAVRIGADKAGKELGADIEHAAPTKPDNIEEQTRLVEDWIVRKPAAHGVRAGGLQGAGAEHPEGEQGRDPGRWCSTTA